MGEIRGRDDGDSSVKVSKFQKSEFPKIVYRRRECFRVNSK